MLWRLGNQTHAIGGKRNENTINRGKCRIIDVCHRNGAGSVRYMGDGVMTNYWDCEYNEYEEYWDGEEELRLYGCSHPKGNSTCLISPYHDEVCPLIEVGPYKLEE